MHKIYRKYIKYHLSNSTQFRLTGWKEFLLDFLRPLRIKKIVTRFLGPQYRVNSEKIEIDLTYVCNLNCANCNRSCSQARTDEKISEDQIEKFIQESKSQNRKWKTISLVGGEPTTHPDLLKIVQLLIQYKNENSPETEIVVVTNGCGDYVKKVLKELPNEVSIVNSAKNESVKSGFDTFNIAPADREEYQNVDFFNACKITKYCGMGLTPYGYYPCAVSGGIDRVFGFDDGRKKLPKKDDDFKDLLNTYCRLCGHFKKKECALGSEMSKTWENAYKKYKKEKPILIKY